MKMMNGEFKKVVDQVKSAQTKINNLLKNQDWMDDARKYAEHQRDEVKKLIADDVTKLRSFLDAERREMDRFQKQIPGEIKKFRNFLKSQRKEFQKLVTQIRKNAVIQTGPGLKMKVRVNGARKAAPKATTRTVKPKTMQKAARKRSTRSASAAAQA